MGGGAAMRAAAKLSGMGVLNAGLHGGGNPVVSAARHASRSVASVVSSSDDVKLAVANNDNKTNSSVEKPYVEIDDWELAGFEDELFKEAGDPLPRLVFGGAPTIQEAKQATSDLNDALEMAYLYPNATNGHSSLHLSDSEHVEAKHHLVSEKLVTPLASNHAIQAFKLLHENADAQNVVASIASDSNVWNAVMQNKAVVDFMQTHKTSAVFPDMDPKVNDTFVDNPQANEPKSASGKGLMDYLEDIKQKITVTVIDMMNSLSDTFQSLFGGSPKGEYAMNPDGTAGMSVEKATIGASLMGLAVMVVVLVVLKRS